MHRIDFGFGVLHDPTLRALIQHSDALYPGRSLFSYPPFTTWLSFAVPSLQRPALNEPPAPHFRPRPGLPLEEGATGQN